MSVITIAANKGGVGKTTITALIASNLAKKKKKVYLIDLDPQLSLKQWWQKREDEDISLVDIKYNQLKDALAKINTKDNCVIIDTPPSHLKIIEQAILVADYILISCRPSPLDIEAIGETLTIIEEHKKNFTFILNSSVSGTQITEQTILLLSKNGQIAPSPIRQRIIYAIAMLDGKTALEMHNKAAISEINELCNFIEGEIKSNEKKPLNLETLGEIRKPRRNEELETSIIRTKRRSERNVQLNLKVTTDFYNNLNKTAIKEQCYMVEVLEKALARYLSS